ncbi:MAG TPA: hypothetical protein VGC76_13065 [Pyrinomonadaceae bacterium]|jgi:hypothetical protein
MSEKKDKEIKDVKIEVAFGALLFPMFGLSLSDIQVDDVIKLFSKREIPFRDVEKFSVEEITKSGKIEDWQLRKPKSIEEIIKSENFRNLIIPKIIESLNSSANLLSLFIVFDSFSKLDWTISQDVINFAYGIYRGLLKPRKIHSKEQKKKIREIKKGLFKLFGARYDWKVVWFCVKEVPSVKKDWEIEENKGDTDYLREKNFKHWQREKQKVANKYYLRLEKEKLEKIETRAKEIQDGFFKRFGFDDSENFFNYFNSYLKKSGQNDANNDATKGKNWGS